jgi:hypothetical protein
LDFDQVGHTANTEIQLPCDCLFSVPEKLLPAQPHAVALRSLTCSNSDTIRIRPGTQPAAVENGPRVETLQEPMICQHQRVSLMQRVQYALKTPVEAH